MGRRLALLAAVVVAVMAVAAGQASALTPASRYGSPTGTNLDPCTAAQPCDGYTAIHSAPSGANVYLYADRGDYSLLGVTIADTNSIHIFGLNGRARLIAHTDATVLALDNASTVENVYLEKPGTDAALSLLSSSFAGNTIAKNSGGGSACYLQNAFLNNTVCWSSAVTPNGAAQTDENNTLRNVTIEATGGGNSVGLSSHARSGGTSSTINLVNVIARGASGGLDIAGDSDGTRDLFVGSVGSNFGSRTTGVLHVDIGPAAQTAQPVLVNRAGGDFHQACGSPTIDAGVVDSVNGTNDYDGDPRTIGPKTDIGADELTAGPKTAALTPSGLTPTSATLSGAVNPSGCATNWRFDYGVATLDSHTPNQSLPVGSVAKPVSAVVTGLKPATTYRFHLVAGSLSGQSTTTESTFKTPADPFAGVVVKSKKGKVKKGKVKIVVSCPTGVPGPCAGTLTLTSSKKIGKKKLKLGSASFSIAAGKSASVTVKLSKKGRAYFKKHAKLAAKASAPAHDGAGTVKGASGKVKLAK